MKTPRIFEIMGEKFRKNFTEPQLKKMRKVTLASIAGLSALAISLGTIITVGCASQTQRPEYISVPEHTIAVEPELEVDENQIEYVGKAEQKPADSKQIYFPEDHKDTMTAEQKDSYEELCKVASQKLETYEGNYKDNDGVTRKYLFVKNEEDLIQLSKELSVAVKNYFKAYGASDWANPDEEMFWPENIEYLVVAIAWRETEYRTNTWNEESGCGGITALNKEMLLKTFTHGNWLTEDVWGKHIPYINCNPNEVDVFNLGQNMLYQYLNIGYNLANRLKNEKTFYDEESNTRIGVWQKLNYTDEMQDRLIIASQLFGINNVVNSVFDRNYNEKEKRYIPLKEYVDSSYTNDVMNKFNELVDKYENQIAIGY